MNNYPDGVTGNEPQIAGYPTMDLTDVECSGGYVTDDEGETVPCEFSGDVEEADFEFGTAYWACPVCSTTNETDIDDEPDPDIAWESRYDYMD